MKLNKLLEKQIRKFFPGQLYEQDEVQAFIRSVNDSYNAYEKDIELSEHAFKITEEEYREVNAQLKQEIDLKGTLINKLKEAVSEIGDSKLMESDDENEILNIAAYLKKQIIQQRETEKKVQDQKQFYEEILNQIPADIAVFDAEQRYLFVNPVSIKDEETRGWIIGKTNEEYCTYAGKSITIAEERRKVFDDIMNSRHQYEWEEKGKNRQGQTEYYLRKMYPVFNDTGALQMAIGYGINITERKNIEEQIRSSEARYRGIFDNSLALICTHDLNGVILDLNKASVDIFEYKREELLGASLQDLVPADRREEFRSQYLEEIKTTGKAEGIMVALNRHGKKIYLLYHNYLVTNDTEDPYVIGFSQDITARFDAERALKKSEEKYRNIIANMNLGLLEVDADQRIIYANHSFCEMSGYDVDELAGKLASAMFLSEADDISADELQHRRKEGASDAYEIRTRNKKGEQKWWLISGAPSFDQRGNFVGSIGIHLDITLQKTLEHDLRKAKSDAELSAKAKEVFLANMSHEIRTPMNAILGIGKLLGKTALGTQQQFYLGTIQNAANNLLVIINDLLDFSKIEAGKLTLEHIGYSLKDTLANAIQILSHKAEEKGLLLSYEHAPEIAPVLIGDPYRINQVLMNLLSNSLKFTESGQVSVKTSLVSQDETAQVVQFKITDTGIGMSEEFMANLFDKFSQEDESVTRRFGGTGLGMSISKELIDLMGGTIAVESAKNKGTVISLVISFRKGTPVDMPQAKDQVIDTQILKGKRLLLVEDNEMNRLLASTILGQFGAEVAEAGNGNIAIDLLAGNSYDLVLMDVQMPVKDGIETTSYIRSYMNKDIPIIALTANAFRKERDRCLAAGMDDFISKPFDEHTLVQMVAKWLGKDMKTNGPDTTGSIASPEVADERLYNLDKLTAISRGNNDFVNQMVALFLESMPDTVQKIQQEYVNRDWKKISVLAHRMKPSVQAMRVQHLDDDLEVLEDLKNKMYDSEVISAHISHLSDVIEKVSAQMRLR